MHLGVRRVCSQDQFVFLEVCSPQSKIVESVVRVTLLKFVILKCLGEHLAGHVVQGLPFFFAQVDGMEVLVEGLVELMNLFENFHLDLLGNFRVGN